MLGLQNGREDKRNATEIEKKNDEKVLFEKVNRNHIHQRWRAAVILTNTNLRLYYISIPYMNSLSMANASHTAPETFNQQA